MRVNTLAAGLIASSLFAGAMASEVSAPQIDDGELHVITQLEDVDAAPPTASEEGSWVFTSPGYLIPTDKELDENAPWAIPVLDPINRDTNESVFDADGYDMVPIHDAEQDTKGLLAPRANTRMWLGRRYIDMGCGETVSSIRGALGDAVYSLCKNGHCDNGDGFKYTRKITWMGGGYARVSRTLEITADGVYKGPHTLGNIHNAVKAMVQSGSVKWSWRSMDLGLPGHVAPVKCKMAKFPNFIRIEKSGGSRDLHVKFWIRMNKVENSCLAADVTAFVVSQINGVAGAFFGALALACAYT